MHKLVIAAALIVFVESRSYGNELDFPLDFMFNDPQAADDCQFNCNSAMHSSNKCVNGKCDCAKGFSGKYCTCEELCSGEFGTCNNDAFGSCTCTPNWKGRNCNCPKTCPDSYNWRCQYGITAAARDCICNVDNLPWVQGKKCCPSKCADAGMECPTDNGVCFCSHTNTYIPYGSPDDAYKCCVTWCTGSLCECRHQGCFVKATGQLATKQADCEATQCKTHDSWQECSDFPWQGKCQCYPNRTPKCRCKCAYGWGGGDGLYAYPGWEIGQPALYTEHCKNPCDWGKDYRPKYCEKCKEVNCPECFFGDKKKCDGKKPTDNGGGNQIY